MRSLESLMPGLDPENRFKQIDFVFDEYFGKSDHLFREGQYLPVSVMIWLVAGFFEQVKNRVFLNLTLKRSSNEKQQV